MAHQADSQDRSFHAEAYYDSIVKKANRRARVWGFLLLVVVVAIALSHYAEPAVKVVPIVRFVIAGVGLVTLVFFAFWGGLAASFWLRAHYDK